MPLFQSQIPPHVASVIRRLPPDIKQGVKAAIRALAHNPDLGVPLTGELEGYWKYRVKRFRIVYVARHQLKRLEVVAVGHRAVIYEELAKQLRAG